MSRLTTRTSQFVIDLAVLTLAFVLAVLVRFDWDVPHAMLRRLVFVLPYVVVLQYTLLMAFGITRFSWRYISLRDAVRIVGAISLAALILVAVRFASEPLEEIYKPFQYGIVPLGVLLADFVLAFVGVTGVRALRRLIGERVAQKQHRPSLGRTQVPTVLIGAGQAGFLVAQEIVRRPDLAIAPVAFVDDDPVKTGSIVHGIKVLGTTADLAKIRASHGVSEALITINNATGAAIRRITDECKRVGLNVKIVPGTYEIVGGRVNLSRIRQVAIQDLLRREPVRLDSGVMGNIVRGKRVLITGAGGSIGSELGRQVALYGPIELVLAERAENSLFHIHRELRTQFPDCRTVPCVADVTDSARIRQLFEQHRPQLVFHAAAHKHVPMMEWNAGEAVKNNTLGTRMVADLAHEFGAEHFVFVSTDKAVNPTSVMGATKRAAELYVQALSPGSETAFVTVRFGNVLGSDGSVIPIFQEQIRNGGPVTVTHPEMKRYFMTIPEACQLVIQAAALSEGGEIFILDMGEPVRIVDLAEDLIRLSGFRPHTDIEIKYTGMRPGEKLFEELSTEGEGIGRTLHPKIFIGRYQTPALREVTEALERLRDASCDGDLESVRVALKRLVPEYQVTEPSPLAAPDTDPEHRSIDPRELS